MKSSTRSMLAAISVFLTPSPSSSQNVPRPERDTVYQISPVIITATQARERISPVTFSDIPSGELRERYSTQDVPALLADLPSSTTYSENGNGIGYNYLTLRGFDQRRLSIMINGVPQNDPEDHNVYWLDVPDLLASAGSVQVQRGAGSAFYGPPAIGGSVNISTNPFSASPGVTIEALAGWQQEGTAFPLNTRKYDASVNSGLIAGGYMLYGRIGRMTSEGYRVNSWTEFNSFFAGLARFDDGLSTRVHFFGGPIRDGLSYFGLPAFVVRDKSLRRLNLASWTADSAGSAFASVSPRRPEESEFFSQPHVELINEWKASPSVIAHSTLFYYWGNGSYDYDASWADTSMLRLGTLYGIPTFGNPSNTIVRATVENRQWGWLPRAEIDHGEGTLTVGGEIRIHRSTHYGTIQSGDSLPAGLRQDYRFYEYNGARDVLSGYAHELYRLTAWTNLMADLQVIYNRYAVRNEKYIGTDFSVPYLFLNPRFGLHVNFDEQWDGYASAALTGREPTMRNLYAAEDSYFGATPQFQATTAGGVVRYDFRRPLARPERLLDVEAGGGYRDGADRIRATIFWMEFTDELVKSGQVDIFGQPVTGNADRSRHIGIELEAVKELPCGVAASGNISLSRNRLVHYAVLDAGTTVVLDGNPIAGFPDLLANLRLTYRSDAAMVSVAGKYVGEFSTSNLNIPSERNDPSVVFNCEATYRVAGILGATMTMRAEVRNMLNNLYFMSGEGNAFFPAAERSFLFGTTLTW